MIVKIKNKIAHTSLGRKFLHLDDNVLIPNINFKINENQKHVLLIYLDYLQTNKQILNYKNNVSGSIHTNRYEFLYMITTLIELNCRIDVCAHDDANAKEYISAQNYDVIIGLGEIYRWAIQEKKAHSILYLTENPYFVSIKKENERLEYFQKRHGIRQKINRSGKFFKENDEKLSDSVICMGDEKYLSHIGKTVYPICPSAFNCEKKIEFTLKNKHCFLVLGTDGFIHKGIDLLIEVFKLHPEWELFLCGSNVTKIAKKLGYKLSGNIHDCGYVDTSSEMFHNLANKCMFILLPSCSEATSTGVLTGMCHGMIPIVSHNLGFEKFEDKCFFFEGFNILDIEGDIRKILDIDETLLKEKCKNIQCFANEKFKIQVFSERFRDIMEMCFNS